MIDNEFKNYIIERLNESEEYIYKAFLYLKELEEMKPRDIHLQEAIWDLCEAGEIISTSVVEFECSKDE